MLSSVSLSKKREWVIHILFWAVWVLFNSLSIAPQDTSSEIKFRQYGLFDKTWLILFSSTFYFHYLIVLPRVFHRFKWPKLLLGIIGTFSFFTSFRFLLEQLITNWLFNSQNYSPGYAPLAYIADNFFFAISPIVISSIFWLIIYLIRLLEYTQIIMEEKKNTEIKFLKAQINPHFIFNTLNNIYSMVYFQSQKSLAAIEKLSQIMRFTTYESQKNKTLLQEELNYIFSYIELEELRHEDNDLIHFSVTGETSHIEIPPYILSPLVENAIKHGASRKPILIDLQVTAISLYFSVKNDIGVKKKDKLGGIGIENLKKRLDIYYATNYSLNNTITANEYTAILNIRF